MELVVGLMEPKWDWDTRGKKGNTRQRTSCKGYDTLYNMKRLLLAVLACAWLLQLGCLWHWSNFAAETIDIEVGNNRKRSAVTLLMRA